MSKTIKLTIQKDEFNEVILVNRGGDTFTYDPRSHQGLHDFLYKQEEPSFEWLSIIEYMDLYAEEVRREPNTMIKFDTGEIAKASEDWPKGIATHFKRQFN